MNIWELTILKIIEANGGTAPLKHIYSQISLFIDLGSHHIEITFNAPAYHHQTRAHIDDLLDNKDVVRVGRGLYSITKKGTQRIKTQRIINP